MLSGALEGEFVDGVPLATRIIYLGFAGGAPCGENVVGVGGVSFTSTTSSPRAFPFALAPTYHALPSLSTQTPFPSLFATLAAGPARTFLHVFVDDFGDPRFAKIVQVHSVCYARARDCQAWPLFCQSTGETVAQGHALIRNRPP